MTSPTPVHDAVAERGTSLLQQAAATYGLRPGDEEGAVDPVRLTPVAKELQRLDVQIERAARLSNRLHDKVAVALLPAADGPREAVGGDSGTGVPLVDVLHSYVQRLRLALDSVDETVSRVAL